MGCSYALICLGTEKLLEDGDMLTTLWASEQCCQWSRLLQKGKTLPWGWKPVIVFGSVF